MSVGRAVMADIPRCEPDMLQVPPTRGAGNGDGYDVTDDSEIDDYDDEEREIDDSPRRVYELDKWWHDKSNRRDIWSDCQPIRAEMEWR